MKKNLFWFVFFTIILLRVNSLKSQNRRDHRKRTWLLPGIQGLSERMIIMISLAYIYFVIKKGYDYDFLDKNCSCFHLLLLVCFQLHQNFSQAPLKPGAAHSPAGLGALPDVRFFLVFILFWFVKLFLEKVNKKTLPWTLPTTAMFNVFSKKSLKN